MNIEDSLHALLYLGQISRDAIGYGKTRGEQDHTWSSYAKMRSAFLNKHPEYKQDLETYMNNEKRKWGTLFGDPFKLNSLAQFVNINFKSISR